MYMYGILVWHIRGVYFIQDLIYTHLASSYIEQHSTYNAYYKYYMMPFYSVYTRTVIVHPAKAGNRTKSPITLTAALN